MSARLARTADGWRAVTPAGLVLLAIDAEFQILPPAEATRVRESLDILVPASLPGYPPSSVALMRAGYVLRDGLFADARRELLTALAGDPDEPTLHLLLGQVYETIGLGELAQREFIEARDLSGRR